MVETRSMMRKRKQEEAEVEAKRARMEGAMTFFAALPTDVLLIVLLKLSLEEVDRWRALSPRVEEVFKEHEHEFPPPPPYDNGGTVHLYRGLFKGQGNYNLTGHVSVRNNFKVTLTNPSAEWIKRHLKRAEFFTFEMQEEFLVLINREDGSYSKFQQFVRQKCNIKYANICYYNGSLQDAIELFDDNTKLEVTVRNSSPLTDEILKKLWMLTIYSVAGIDADRILDTHKNLVKVYMNVEEDNYPTLRFLEQWKRGEREIKAWFIYCNVETDIPLGRTVHRRNDGKKEIRVTVQKTESKTLVTFSAW